MVFRAGLLSLLLLLAGPALAETLTGRVVGITDGDTLRLLTPAHVLIKIRLAEIDAPEHDQPYGYRSKQVLADLVFGKVVVVKDEGHDRYGRTIGLIFLGPLNISEEMVREGAAWVYWRYNHDPALLAVEAQARTARLGLWALPDDQREPPWQWRMEH